MSGNKYNNKSVYSGWCLQAFINTSLQNYNSLTSDIVFVYSITSFSLIRLEF